MKLTKNLNYILVLDIETIPDTSLAYNLCDIEKDKNHTEQELRTIMENYHAERYNGNSFLRQPFHRIVCISYVLLKITREGDQEYHELIDINSISAFKSSEKELIQKFWEIFNKYKPQLVTWNGANFDIPVLKYRTMKYGLSGDWFYKYGDKWDNYYGKYSNINIDLMLALSNFGAAANLKLMEICSLLSIPCKLGIDGSQIPTYYDQERYTEIREYCETDILATYLVLLRYYILIGAMSKHNYNAIVSSIEQYIISSDKVGLKQFLEEWYKLNNNTLKL